MVTRNMDYYNLDMIIFPNNHIDIRNRFRMLKKGVLLLKDLFFPREIFIFALKWNCYEQI